MGFDEAVERTVEGGGGEAICCLRRKTVTA